MIIYFVIIYVGGTEDVLTTRVCFSLDEAKEYEKGKKRKIKKITI